MEEDKGRVCVTGGTGFIASWIIKRLLENGYSVNATVRPHPPGHKKDLSFLTNLPGASQKLQILSADLDYPESFKDAIEGCMGVFHVASPMDFEKKEAEEIVIKRSINGALGILKACVTSKTVKRVVYTSGASANCFNGKEDEVKDESLWSDVDYLRTCKAFKLWSYAVCKTLTEKAVLEFGEQNGLDVVTVIPTFVVGPFICPKLPRSILSALSFAFGKKESAGFKQIPMVHVDDVARAHIFLLEQLNPKGRYNCSACLATLEKAFEVICSKFPEFRMLTIDSSLQERNGLKFPDLSSKKLMDAGFEFKCGLEDMLVDAIACCKAKGYL